MANPQTAGQAQQSLGLPIGFKAFSPFPFMGMNAQSSGIAVRDQEFIYVENFLKLGDGYLRAAWDVAAPLYRVTQNSTPNLTIVSFFFFNIASVFYVAIFFSDGSAVSVNVGSGVVTTIAGAGTFYVNGQTLPACVQWGTQYLLISNRNTNNDYWIWDGSLLYTSGTAAPNGVIINSVGRDYSSLPTLTAFGGHGSGMVLVPSINAGGVVNVQITNPGSGYQPGDVVQIDFEGGGSDSSAILTANLGSGSVAAATVTAAGSGYTTGATAGFSGGGGSSAAATVTIGSGIATLTVTAGGSGYTTAGVSFSGGAGSGATATATIVGGVVTGLVIVNPGTGYTSGPTVTISGNGTGATATATVQNFIVTGITITNGGSGYTSAPTITISPVGAGSGATASAVLSGAGVASVTVTDPGSGFTSVPNVAFVGGGGAGASGVVVLNATHAASIQVTAPGQNYQTAPNVLFNPSSYGIAATAVISGGAVTQVVLTNTGAGITGNVQVIFQPQPGDPGSGAGAQVLLVPVGIAGVTISAAGQDYSSAPAVIVSAGSNNSAYATINLMPFGVSGAAIETFLSRVWLVDPADPKFGTLPAGGNMLVSAPSSFSDFAPADGGVQFTSADGFLQTKFTGIRQSNGYLYVFGDGSVSVISNVLTSGAPPITTFNYQNVDPQTGLSWRDSRQDFGRSLVFGNETGIYGLYGGAVAKISAKLDQLFVGAVFPPTIGAVTPSAAIGTLFDVKHYLMLVTITDPDSGQLRTVMVTWNEKDWVITSQSSNLIYIGPQKVESRFQVWGTDGQSLFPMFAQPSSTLVKRLDTKLYGADRMMIIKDMMGFWVQAQDRSAGQVGIALTASFAMSGLEPQASGATPQTAQMVSGVYLPLIGQPQFNGTAAFPAWPLWGTGTTGLPFVTVGARLTSTSPDFAIGNLMIGYKEQTALFSG